MKRFYLIVFIISLCSANAMFSQNSRDNGKHPKVIAHRGYWTPDGCAQNSLSSLKKAQEFGAWGSEFDVNMTKDGVIIVSHGPDLEEIPDVQQATYKEVKKVRLSKNGEKVPTLKQYLKQGKKSPQTKLIFELKTHEDPAQETEIITRAMQLIRKYKIKDQVIFISFSLHALKEMVRLGEGIPVQSLISEISPKELAKYGIKGVDYNYKVFRKHPEWYKDARDLGMDINVWTVSTEDILKEVIDLGVDYITTDNPALARKMTEDK